MSLEALRLTRQSGKSNGRQKSSLLSYSIPNSAPSRSGSRHLRDILASTGLRREAKSELSSPDI
jgi:hypothetical protein